MYKSLAKFGIRRYNIHTGQVYQAYSVRWQCARLVGYVGVKDEDKAMADSLLVFGLVWTIILAIFYWALITSLLSHIKG
jgi:hypothetical protein